MQRLTSPEELERFTGGQAAALLYFSGPGCSVCGALKPRVAAMAAEEFPELPVAEVDCERSPDLAAQCGVFSIPTVIVWFDGRESVRKARAFSLGELQEAIERPYAMLFEV